MSKLSLFATGAAIALSLASSVSARTYYVDAVSGHDGNTGLKTNLAFKTLQKAIDKAASGSTILVAPGTYTPIVSKNKKLTIRGVEGAEATVIEGSEFTIGSSVFRDQTPLCDLGRHGKAKVYEWDEMGKRYWTGLYDEDAMLGGTSTAVEGFTLRRAVNGAWGGKLTHCVISNLTQNAVWATTLSDSLVSENVQTNVYWFYEGDGALVRGGTLNRCRILRNSVVQGVWGAALLNCLVADNRQEWTVPVNENGYFTGSGDPNPCRGDLIEKGSLVNCTIASNRLKEIPLFKTETVGYSQFGPKIEFKMTGEWSNGVAIASADCSNCIVWDNVTDRTAVPADFARMEKKTFKTTIYETDPLFRDPDGGDWRLLPWSSCRDAGTDLTKKTGKFDIDGRPRKIGGAVDVGAFEHPQGVPVQADWDGDGKTDPATWNADTSEWCIWESSTQDVKVMTFGEKGATPIAVDKDGDGTVDPGYYTAATREPAFVFYLSDGTVVRTNLGAKASTPLLLVDAESGERIPVAWSGTAKKPKLVFADGRPSIVFGAKGAKALAADFDGDKVSDFAFYTASSSKPAFSVLSSRNEFSPKALFPSGKAVAIGVKKATPSVADFDGDGNADFGTYSGSAKAPILYRILSSSRWRETRTLPFGEKGSVAVPGDWDGDGIADPAFLKGACWTWLDTFFDPTVFYF